MARGEPLIRQWNLLKILQAHQFGIGVGELAERLECSKRQVQRDLNVLQQSGFPITFDRRDFGKKFWTLSPRFIEREHLILSVTEMLTLFLSQQLLAPLSGTELGDGLTAALDKIKALLPAKSLAHFSKLNEAVLVKNIPFHDYSAQNKEIAILNAAIAGQSVLKIRYGPPNRDPFDGLFHPYGLILIGAGFYCVGQLIRGDRRDIRKLKVSRCLGVELTADSFQRPDNFSLESCLQGGFGIYSTRRLRTVKVRLTGWAGTSVREQQWHQSQKIVEDTREQVVAEFRLSDAIEFKRWVLGFGRHAVILQPRDLAADIASELAAARDAYGDNTS